MRVKRSVRSQPAMESLGPIVLLSAAPLRSGSPAAEVGPAGLDLHFARGGHVQGSFDGTNLAMTGVADGLAWHDSPVSNLVIDLDWSINVRQRNSLQTLTLTDDSRSKFSRLVGLGAPDQEGTLLVRLNPGAQAHYYKATGGSTRASVRVPYQVLTGTGSFAAATGSGELRASFAIINGSKIAGSQLTLEGNIHRDPLP